MESFYTATKLVGHELNIPMSHSIDGPIEGKTSMKLIQFFDTIVEVKCAESIDGPIETSTIYFVGSVVSKKVFSDEGIEAIKFRVITPNHRLVFQDEYQGGPYLFPGFVSPSGSIRVTKVKRKY